MWGTLHVLVRYLYQTSLQFLEIKLHLIFFNESNEINISVLEFNESLF